MRLPIAALALPVAVQAANYSGPLRPQVHFSPPSDFMNDPNGLFYDAKRDLYHLYYQWNPYELIAGNQHWGHATSRDLYHWTNHPPAISPSNADEYIFSGSAVLDRNNTSGFFPDQDDGVVAIYTLDTAEAQTQNIAYSTDGGYTFTKYTHNPVIDINSTEFRDPQVTWHAESEQWLMTVAYSADKVIGFYTSPDLRDWTHASNFSRADLRGEQFECPNLVKFAADKHVLFISVNPGAPLGGSGTYYLVGNFNGTHFHPETANFTLYEFSKDNYASQWYTDLPDRSSPISIGWASNWDYAEEVPTGELEDWRSSMSVPRQHSLTQVQGVWTVTRSPYDLSAVQGRRLPNHNHTDGVSVDFSSVQSKAIYFEIDISGLPADPAGEVRFHFSSPAGDHLDGGVVLDTGLFWIDRAGTQLYTAANNTDFTPLSNTSVAVDGGLAFAGVIDRSVLEVFADDGTQSATVSYFPSAPLDRLAVGARGLSDGANVGLAAWGLDSGWVV
ncbi:hypothetical protein BO70DRAFT_372860 [Aspergillus heteromorphus CBS 117.55]|uniref:Beta-fructofuranosidase n=1 Tax=Aspergillus heteromorphus CBS 117.55 TaxID=1448321 RepID=A0A317VT47_9EURO|nr:uncharacterized protein BO70DRAFT_372860 [Aspergillus heteromorphus CBS 117.55]PWY75100.1 hypothetical protein BO70DRAFT_372860 [Aspergillus heteromorphus CBS 117.55]